MRAHKIKMSAQQNQRQVLAPESNLNCRQHKTNNFSNSNLHPGNTRKPTRTETWNQTHFKTNKYAKTIKMKERTHAINTNTKSSKLQQHIMYIKNIFGCCQKTNLLPKLNTTQQSICVSKPHLLISRPQLPGKLYCYWVVNVWDLSRVQPCNPLSITFSTVYNSREGVACTNLHTGCIFLFSLSVL